MPLIVPDLCPERQGRQRPAWSPPPAARWSRRSRSAVHHLRPVARQARGHAPAHPRPLESTDSSVESHDDDLPELPALIRSSDLSRLS